MATFKKSQNFSKLQKVVNDIYSLQNDRFYSLSGLLVQEQRFAMRTLKGIRKGNNETIKTNLLISLSWLCSIANRLHIDMENDLWNRFPLVCPYCGKNTCECKKVKPKSRKKVSANKIYNPKSIQGFQVMFKTIYPPESRTLADAGIHFAEEVGEVSEAIHNYLGQHIESQFDEIRLEIADLLSNVFGIANSANINIAKELSLTFKQGCHICHGTPCVCSYSFIIDFK